MYLTGLLTRGFNPKTLVLFYIISTCGAMVSLFLKLCKMLVYYRTWVKFSILQNPLIHLQLFLSIYFNEPFQRWFKTTGLKQMIQQWSLNACIYSCSRESEKQKSKRRENWLDFEESSTSAKRREVLRAEQCKEITKCWLYEAESDTYMRRAFLMPWNNHKEIKDFRGPRWSVKPHNVIWLLNLRPIFLKPST